jgi:hypothetical protein
MINKLSISQKIKKELKKTGLIQEGLKWVECERLHIYYHESYIFEKSVMDILSKFETNDGGQITGKITIAICDMFMIWLCIHGNEYLKKSGSKLKIISREKIKKKSSEFDICFELDGEECLYEIKFSQNNNSTQGATHGNNKVNDFIIIEFKFDINRIITKSNKGILGNIWIGITKEKPSFIGEATTKSSRTKFEYTYIEYSIDEMKDCIIFGDFSKKRKGSKKYNLIGNNIY